MTPHFDQSTFLAARALDAIELGPPPVPTHLALPGAKTAIEHDRLRAHQELGHDQHTIVERVNERWERENAARLEQHARWVNGPYQAAIEQMRQAEIQAKAEELRKRALFEQLILEREQG